MKNEPYRNEDQTLEKIREKYNELSREIKGDTPSNEVKTKLWNNACEIIHDEMIDEGLFETAKEVIEQMQDGRKVRTSRFCDTPKPKH